MAKTNIPLPAIIAIVVLAVLIILWYSVLYRLYEVNRDA